jgi:periplasmic divalent cation tolerance protein
MERAVAVGPMRLVVCVFPDTPEVAAMVRGAVERRLAACANSIEANSTYLWRDAMETARERLVLFKTSVKNVAALFRYLGRVHPYEVPDIFELDVARVHPPYLAYLLETIDQGPPPPPLGGGPARATRPEGRRARGGRGPGRTRAPRRLRSR